MISAIYSKPTVSIDNPTGFSRDEPAPPIGKGRTVGPTLNTSILHLTLILPISL